jgi:hypothetical protein
MSKAKKPIRTVDHVHQQKQAPQADTVGKKRAMVIFKSV